MHTDRWSTLKRAEHNPDGRDVPFNQSIEESPDRRMVESVSTCENRSRSDKVDEASLDNAISAGVGFLSVTQEHRPQVCQACSLFAGRESCTDVFNRRTKCTRALTRRRKQDRTRRDHRIRPSQQNQPPHPLKDKHNDRPLPAPPNSNSVVNPTRFGRRFSTGLAKAGSPLKSFKPP